MLNRPWFSPVDLAPAARRARYMSAILLVLIALGLRFTLTPFWGAQHAFTVFYPAVFLSAYLAGTRPGLVATALSAVLGFWAFVPPAFQVKPTSDAVGYMLFFAFNCTVAVVLIHGLTQSLFKISREQRRAETVAQGHADLFRELNERVSNHLQLVGGLLALQGAGELEPKLSAALAKASETSLFLARVHREVSGREAELVEFAPFAQALVAAKLVQLGQPVDRMVVESDELLLPHDQATSLGVALLECSGPLLAGRKPGRLSVRFESRRDSVVMRVTETGDAAGEMIRLADAYLLRSVVQQVGGRLSLSADASGHSLEVAFTMTPASPAPNLQSTVH